MFNELIKKYKKSYKNKEEYKSSFNIYREKMKKVEIIKRKEKGNDVYGEKKFDDIK